MEYWAHPIPGNIIMQLQLKLQSQLLLLILLLFSYVRSLVQLLIFAFTETLPKLISWTESARWKSLSTKTAKLDSGAWHQVWTNLDLRIAFQAMTISNEIPLNLDQKMFNWSWYAFCGLHKKTIRSRYCQKDLPNCQKHAIPVWLLGACAHHQLDRWQKGGCGQV